jgi:hypothetical protein
MWYSNYVCSTRPWLSWVWRTKKMLPTSFELQLQWDDVSPDWEESHCCGPTSIKALIWRADSCRGCKILSSDLAHLSRNCKLVAAQCSAKTQNFSSAHLYGCCLNKFLWKLRVTVPKAYSTTIGIEGWVACPCCLVGNLWIYLTSYQIWPLCAVRHWYIRSYQLMTIVRLICSHYAPRVLSKLY